MKRLILAAVLAMAATPAIAQEQRAQGFQSAYTLNGAHTVFGSVEHSERDRLFAPSTSLAGETFEVGKISAGYIFDMPLSDGVSMGIGAAGSIYDLPPGMENDSRGDTPAAAMFVLRFRFK